MSCRNKITIFPLKNKFNKEITTKTPIGEGDEIAVTIDRESMLEKYIFKMEEDRRESEQRIAQERRESEQRIVDERRLSEERMEKKYNETISAIKDLNNNIDSRITSLENKIDVRINRIEDKMDNTNKWIIALCISTIIGITAIVASVLLAK